MRHGVKFLVNELLSNTTVNFGMHIFLGKPLQETFQICWEVLKFVLEIRQGSEAFQIIKFAQLSNEALFSFKEFKMSIRENASLFCAV